MRSRLRSLAALLALCALSLSMTGSAWAAMCDGLRAVAPAAAAAGGHGSAHGHGHHGAAPASHGEHQRSGEGEAPTCPLMAPGAAGSCLGTFVGAAPSARSASTDPESHDFPLPRAERGLLDASPPFRPPEA
jgi:hypothetical protein